jgi:hypothetical protein
LPIDGSLFLGDAGGPRDNFELQHLEVADAAVFQALTGRATQLAFRHVEPTAVLGGVNEVYPADIISGFFRRKRFVERPLGVRIQIVADQRDLLDAGVTCVEQMGDFMSPIVLGASWPGGRLAVARERFGKHKNARCPLAFVVVIDPLRMLFGRRDGREHLMRFPIDKREAINLASYVNGEILKAEQSEVEPDSISGEELAFPARHSEDPSVREYPSMPKGIETEKPFVLSGERNGRRMGNVIRLEAGMARKAAGGTRARDKA